MLAAQTEARHDDYEREAQLAIMREHASRAKKPKASDLYKRPTTKAATKEIENQAAKAEHAQEWLGQFAFEARGK